MTRDIRGPFDHKVRATITDRQPWHCIATDGNGVRYFLNYKSCEATGLYDFEDLQVGSKVKLTPIMAPGKGFRGIEVQILEL